MPSYPDPRRTIDLVEVATAADGMPTRLVIRPEAMRLTPTRLAEVVLAALREAHAAALSRLVNRFEELQFEAHTPSIRRTRELAEQVRSEVHHQAEQLRGELEVLRRKLSELTNG